MPQRIFLADLFCVIETIDISSYLPENMVCDSAKNIDGILQLMEFKGSSDLPNFDLVYSICTKNTVVGIVLRKALNQTLLYRR